MQQSLVRPKKASGINDTITFRMFIDYKLRDMLRFLFSMKYVMLRKWEGRGRGVGWPTHFETASNNFTLFLTITDLTYT